MKKILIVEDDPVAGMVFQRTLEKQGFATELATDGAQGLKRLAESPPDALLLDVMMPKVGGIALLGSLRADPNFREMPVVVMTNACVPAFVEQALNAGANHVVDKSNRSPLAVAELLYSLLKLGAEKNIASAG